MTPQTRQDGRRQVARALAFPANLAPYIDWQKIGAQAAELAADLETVRDAEGGITVTLLWRNGEHASPAQDRLTIETVIAHVGDILRRMMGATAADPYVRANERDLGVRA